ncbi:uncharacterized protein LOC142902782 isoform X1 [Nelusetta ayraudi]|uniref:uncharacterized protein LOC142902782 isoform X1 n=1 Tax=Nelusetta ayraudi TaxID=303726 RepID=UPI003F6E7779
MQQENQASVGKLQQMVEQCEWLCQQQRHWMLCVRRFKESLVEERGALLRGVSVLERKVAKMKLRRDASAQSNSGTPWRDDEAEPESQVEKSNTPRRELCDQTGSLAGGHQKPP